VVRLPLKDGEDKESFAYNVKETMNTYDVTGKIGKSKPDSRKKALQQALSIAYSKKSESQ